MDAAVACFDEYFGQWDIQLPPDDVTARRAGRIVAAGWWIVYQFGKDDRGEYLDYYAAHRMTSDTHVRLREDGTRESLPALSEWCLTSKDPVENERLRREFVERNREVARMLDEKGFGLRGPAPPAVQLNTYLKCGGGE